MHVRARSATLVDRNAFTLGGNLSVTDALRVTATGAIGQSGALNLDADTTLSAVGSSGVVVLDDAGNDLGLMKVSALRATLVDGVGHFTLGGGISVTDSLTVRAVDSADGGIYQLGAVSLGSSTSLFASGAVVLDDAGNDFGLVHVRARSATLVDRNAFTLGGNLSVTDALRVTAAGVIGQSGALNLDADTTLSAVGLSGVVVLDDAGNDLGLMKVSALRATLVDGVGHFTLGGGVSVTDSLTVRAVDSADGGIYQLGAVSLGSSTSLFASGAVVLDDAGNDFGLVHVRARSATLVDRNAFTLGGNLSVTDALRVTATGVIGQSGALNLDADTTLSAVGLSGVVVLDDVGNDLGLMKVSALRATLVDGVGHFTLGGGVSVTDSLTVRAVDSADGGIYQSGAVSLGSSTSLFASGAVVLDDASNDFGLVHLRAHRATLVDRNTFGVAVYASASRATLFDGVGAFTLGAASVASPLAVRAVGSVGGERYQSGALSLDSSPSLSASGVVVADDAGNDVGVVQRVSSEALFDGVGIVGGDLLVPEVLHVTTVNLNRDLELAAVRARNSALYDGVGDFIPSGDVPVVDVGSFSVVDDIDTIALPLTLIHAAIHTGTGVDDTGNDRVGLLNSSLPAGWPSILVDRNTFIIGSHDDHAFHQRKMDAATLAQWGSIDTHTDIDNYGLFVSGGVGLDRTNNRLQILSISAASNISLRTDAFIDISRTQVTALTTGMLIPTSENKVLRQWLDTGIDISGDVAINTGLGNGAKSTGVLLQGNGRAPGLDSSRGRVPAGRPSPLARYLREPDVIIELGSELAGFLSLGDRHG